MKQRSFPWLQSLTPPSDAPISVVAQCVSYAMAACVSLASKSGGPWTQRWLARRLGVKPPYLNRILRDQQPMPEWMHRPIAWATGSRLLLQYDDLQCKTRAQAETERDVIRRLAAMTRRAA